MTNWKTKLILCITLIFSISIANPFPVQGQDNINHWAQVDLWELGARGIIDPESEPEEYLTRAKFTAMLVKSLGLELEALRLEGIPSTFIDVPNNHPQKGYINLALERGLVGGYSAEIFRPNEELRRDQMIVLLLRLMGVEDLKAEEKYLTFTDAKYIPEYARPSISQGVKMGLVAGYTDKTFRPAEKVTLAEGSAFINRWLELMGDRYDYTGTFQGTKNQGGFLELAIGDSQISFPVNSEVQIIVAKEKANWNDLKIGQQVSLKLNFQGEVILVQQKDVEITEIPYKLEARKLPRFNTREALPQVANLFNPRMPLDPDNIQQSINTAKAEINIPSLVATTKSDGRGQVIALIDTGVDPSHPDLAVTTDGRPKLVEWVDFTLEGIVDIFPASEVKDKTLFFQGQEYTLGDIPSRSNNYRMGLLNLNDILPLELIDKTNPRQVAVLVTDATTQGIYDTVYVDINNDQSFVEEKALTIFKKDQSYVSLGYKGASLALALVDISPQGNYVQFANDISGHGTHVAGIIGANGSLQGVAPGAQIMVLKAVDRDGYANPENIAEAIRYAAIHGADIINISLGQYQESAPGQSDLAKLVNEVIEKYNVLVVSAAGNVGPGINTVASPADADGAISVGAFVSPRMWQVDFDYRVPKDSLYYFSSVGPRKDGAWYPTLVAPGSAVSTVPRWMGHDYLLTEGTSMATPYVSGVAAHLLENAAKNNIKVTPALIKRAMEESARNLTHFKEVEDGHGVLDAYNAWLKLKELNSERKIKVDIFNPQFSNGPGIFAREYLPAQLNLKLKNDDVVDYHLEWQASESWIKPLFKTTHIMRKSERDIPLAFELPDKPGIYSGVLVGNDTRYKGTEVEIPINIIVGERVHEKPQRQSTHLNKLEAAQLARYFVYVPEGTTGINAKLEVFPDTSSAYQGRGRLHLINPFGFEEKMSEYAGENPGLFGRKGWVELTTFFPVTGTWEVVVYSSAALSTYNLSETKYELTLELGEILDFSEEIDPQLELIMSPLPEKAFAKSGGTVILHLWDNNHNKPYSGALEVNGQLYQIQNGRLEYSLEKLKANKEIKFTILI